MNFSEQLEEIKSLYSQAEKLKENFINEFTGSKVNKIVRESNRVYVSDQEFTISQLDIDENGEYIKLSNGEWINSRDFVIKK